jgi:hypothetical protein
MFESVFIQPHGVEKQRKQGKKPTKRIKPQFPFLMQLRADRLKFEQESTVERPVPRSMADM